MGHNLNFRDTRCWGGCSRGVLVMSGTSDWCGRVQAVKMGGGCWSSHAGQASSQGTGDAGGLVGTPRGASMTCRRPTEHRYQRRTLSSLARTTPRRERLSYRARLRVTIESGEGGDRVACEGSSSGQTSTIKLGGILISTRRQRCTGQSCWRWSECVIPGTRHDVTAEQGSWSRAARQWVLGMCT